MTDLTGKILDFLDDEGDLYKAAAEQGHVPHYVVGAPVPTPESMAKLADHAFCLIYHDQHGDKIRKYAADTPGNAWLSTLYFLNEGHALSHTDQAKVAEQLASRCDLFQITDANELLTQLAEGKIVLENKVASAYGSLDESHFALVREGRGLFPLVTREHVKEAVRYWNDNWHFFDPADRREYCKKVAARVAVLEKASGAGAPRAFEGALEQAAKKVVPIAKNTNKPIAVKATKAIAVKKALELPNSMLNYASDVLDHRKLGAAIHDRITRLPDDDEVSQNTLMQLWENRGTLAADGPEKIAECLEEFDRRSGLNRLWDSKIPDPYASVFAKQAELADQVIYDENGLQVTRTMIDKLGQHPELVAQQFDRSFASEFAKDPMAAFEALPREDKQAIAEMAAGFGQGPANIAAAR